MKDFKDRLLNGRLTVNMKHLNRFMGDVEKRVIVHRYVNFDNPEYTWHYIKVEAGRVFEEFYIVETEDNENEALRQCFNWWKENQ